MENLVFKLNGEEFITLTKLLKNLSIIGSGGEIKIHLDNEGILYNDEIEFRKRKKCFNGDVIKFYDEFTIKIED